MNAPHLRMLDPAEEAAREMEALLAAAEPVDAEAFTFGGRRLSPTRIVELLAPYLTERRRARIDDVLAGRTYTVATVVDGLLNTGNVSAVMRTAEALGYQAFHVVTHEDDDLRFKSSERVTQGAEKWLDVRCWPTPAACVDFLKQRGYRVVVTHLDDRAVPIDALDFTQRTALVFGNELHGVTDEMLALADRTCLVPMPGFTRSFNISVAAAVCLYHARQDRLARQGFHGDLADAERATLRALFYLKSVRHARHLIERVLEASLE